MGVPLYFKHLIMNNDDIILKLNDLIRIPPNLEVSDKKIKIINPEQISKPQSYKDKIHF